MSAKTTLTFEAILASQQRTPAWRVEDLIGGERRLDFTKPFMPEGLAGVEPLTFLSRDERRTLNQIRGHEYLSIFGLVEEFILPFVLDHARPRLRDDDHRVRALLQFAGEEAKHIQLFKGFRESFVAGFGTPCNVIGPPEAVAAEVLKHHPLAVALLILHIEWMTQKHFLEGVKDNGEIDPLFRSLLKHHWMEEANHAKLDTLMVQALGENCTLEERMAAFNQYLELGMFIDQGLASQLDMNLEAFQQATGRKLSDEEESKILEVQRRAMRWTYIGSGITHPMFLESVEGLEPMLRRKAEEVAPTFC
jgi:para-aminobenzoate N-oxygenase AurF